MGLLRSVGWHPSPTAPGWQQWWSGVSWLSAYWPADEQAPAKSRIAWVRIVMLAVACAPIAFIPKIGKPFAVIMLLCVVVPGVMQVFLPPRRHYPAPRSIGGRAGQ